MPGINRLRIYFDSCIAIYLVEKREPWHSRLRAQLGRLTQTELEVIFTDLNRREFRIVAFTEHQPSP